MISVSDDDFAMCENSVTRVWGRSVYDVHVCHLTRGNGNPCFVCASVFCDCSCCLDTILFG